MGIEMVMTKDCIQDFIEAWKQYDTAQSGWASWNRRFQDAGYYHVELKNFEYNKWHTIHAKICDWCDKQFGSQHYAWAGKTIFWFETEQHAMWFTLRWA